MKGVVQVHNIRVGLIPLGSIHYGLEGDVDLGDMVQQDNVRVYTESSWSMGREKHSPDLNCVSVLT